MDRLKAVIRHPGYHAVMAVTYIATAVPILLWWASSVRLVLAISIETAISTHLGAWAAEDAAEPSDPAATGRPNKEDPHGYL